MASSIFQARMSKFDQIVNKETVASFGIHPDLWSDAHQRLLHEGMILAWKENPEWTDEQATKECRKQTNQILFDWFRKNLGHLIQETDLSYNAAGAFEIFKRCSPLEFLVWLNEKQEYHHFCCKFYTDLRELYNVSSVEMEEEYKRMKDNKWDFFKYRKWLNDQKKKRGL